MSMVISVLICLACMSHGQELQGSPVAESQTQATGKVHSARALAMVLAALKPDAAFQSPTASSGVRLPRTSPTHANVQPVARHGMPKMDADEDALDKLDAIVEAAESRAVKAVFAYAGDRGDFTPKGDEWGILKRTKASWTVASLPGFGIFLESGMKQPYAARSEGDTVIGTVLTWPEGYMQDALKEIDEIKGYVPDADEPEESICEREVVEVFPVGSREPVPAYVYFQSKIGYRGIAKKIPSGDWLEGRDETAPKTGTFGSGPI